MIISISCAKRFWPGFHFGTPCAVQGDGGDSDVRLDDANLSNADLSDADLEGTDLTGANLTGANMHHADVSRAICGSIEEPKPRDPWDTWADF